MLHPDRVLIHPKSATLFLADAHFGKSATFRQGGIPVPSGIMQLDLNRLSKLIQQFQIEELFFLGDLFHSSINTEWIEFMNWRKQHHQVRTNLIAGNHDILDSDAYENAQIEMHSESHEWNGVHLRHHPVETGHQHEMYPYFCGHVHPGVRMSAPGKFNETLPCFQLSGSMLMLPAFGSFTGLGVIQPQIEDRVFVVAGSLVHEVVR